MCYALNSVTCYDFTVLYIGISRRLLGTCASTDSSTSHPRGVATSTHGPSQPKAPGDVDRPSDPIPSQSVCQRRWQPSEPLMLVSAHAATAAAQHGVTSAHVGSNVEFLISHIAQSHAIVDAARHGAHRLRLLPRCAPCPPLLAAPLACSQHDVR